MRFARRDLLRWGALGSVGALLPGGLAQKQPDPPKWRVHDENRPQPPVVTPGATFSQGAPAPSDAVVLFDGKNLDAWTSDGGPARWKVQDGAFVVAGGNLATRQEFGDGQYHLEFWLPKSNNGGQGRSNSGVFLMGRYEIQVLDNFGSTTYPDGMVSSLYGQEPPSVNAALPPETWQTYDILFRAPVFEGDRVVRPATVTVLLNGVAVHVDRAFKGLATHGQEARYSPHPPKGPIVLQDHGNPIRFRNVWVRPI